MVIEDAKMYIECMTSLAASNHMSVYEANYRKTVLSETETPQ
jgi:hypothetical protein